jgi:hypothetical protein
MAASLADLLTPPPEPGEEGSGEGDEGDEGAEPGVSGAIMIGEEASRKTGPTLRGAPGGAAPAAGAALSRGIEEGGGGRAGSDGEWGRDDSEP